MCPSILPNLFLYTMKFEKYTLTFVKSVELTYFIRGTY